VRDEEVVIAALEAVNSMAVAGRLHGLCGPNVDTNYLFDLAHGMVRLAEEHHKKKEAVAPLLVTIAATVSDGTGRESGGVPGDQWREVFGKAAAVAAPMRVLYGQSDDPELVCAAGIALRCLTFESADSCSHAGRLKAASAILSVLQKYSRSPDTARELLSALANCGADVSVRSDFQAGLPDTADVIYIAMQKSAREDPDVLAQGCRALGALSSSSSAEGGRNGHTFDLHKVKLAAFKAAAGLVERAGGSVTKYSSFLLETVPSDAVEQEGQQLISMCDQLLNGKIAQGPQFGRIVSATGQPLITTLRRRGSSQKRKATPSRRTSGGDNRKP
jgi:hypothetical protein